MFAFLASQFASYYTIVAPESIRPHSDYQVSVTVHNQTEPVRVKLYIKDDENYEKSTEVTVANNQTRLAVIRLDAFAVNHNYKFAAEGVSGLIFRNFSSVQVESKNCSIFIQTDKAIYKPGDVIKFRVLVLNFRLQPVELERGQLKIWITVLLAHALLRLNSKIFTVSIRLDFRMQRKIV